MFSGDHSIHWFGEVAPVKKCKHAQLNSPSLVELEFFPFNSFFGVRGTNTFCLVSASDVISMTCHENFSEKQHKTTQKKPLTF